MTGFSIVPVPAERRAEVAGRIEAGLLSDLARVNAQSVNESIVLAAEDEMGALAAGVAGSTSYGWFLIKLVWVADAHKGQGLGRDLMARAEAEARRLGCHHAWLDTSNPAARAFYVHLGYTEFGRLENGPTQEPADHCRWFLKKPL